MFDTISRRAAVASLCLSVAVTPSTLHAQDHGAGAAAVAAIAPSYVLQMEGQSDHPWVWRVSGGSELVEIEAERRVGPYPVDGGEPETEWETEMFAGPALGGVPHTIEDNFGVLVPALEPAPPGVESGEVVQTELGGMAYDSVRWHVTRGDRDQSVDGRDTEHWVLTVVSSGQMEDGSGGEIAFLSSGKADLWMDPSLPFSIVPFSVARGSGFPLGVLDPAAARSARDAVLPELRQRGLLMRAEVSARQERHIEGFSGPMTLEGDDVVVTVSDVRVDGAPFDGAAGEAEDGPLTRLVRLDAARASALTASGYMASVCEMATGMSASSRASGMVSGMQLEGGAVVARGDGAFRLAIATPVAPDSDLACVVALAPGVAGTGPLEAALPDVTSLRSGPPAGQAWMAAVLVDAQTGTRSIFVAESGSLDLAEVGPEQVEGSVSLSGWTLVVEGAADGDPNAGASSSLVEGASVDVSFTALEGS